MWIISQQSLHFLKKIVKTSKSHDMHGEKKNYKNCIQNDNTIIIVGRQILISDSSNKMISLGKC